MVPVIWTMVAKLCFKATINWQEMVAMGVGTCLFVAATHYILLNGKSGDTQLFNGYVTSKTMKQQNCPSGWVDYEDSFCSEYDTREVYSHTSCTTDSKGNQSCTDYYDTEYNYDYPWERRWYVHTTLGRYQVRRVDRQGRNEPKRYNIVNKFDPVSDERDYDNWVKAVPDSLFNRKEHKSHAYDQKIPPYPRVYDMYRVNRVVTVGASAPKELNFELGKMLGRLNPKHQVNVIVIVTNIQDPMYKYAVENAWIGGKKNDVIIFMGMDGDKLVWADTMTWAANEGNGLFNSTLKDAIISIGGMDVPKIVSETERIIRDHYDRPEMETFAYLQNAIEPPLWLLIVEIIMLAILSFVFHKYDFNPLKQTPQQRALRGMRRSINSYRNSRW
jgi:hypothetical protein